jgi:hypothetical protein
MAPESESKMTNEEIHFPLARANPTLATVPEDAPIDHALIDTLGHILTHVMEWSLELALLNMFLLQTNIHDFEDLLEFAGYSFDDYHKMYDVLFCLEYIEQIVDIKILATLYQELDICRDHSIDLQGICPSTFCHHKCQAKKQALKEFQNVLDMQEAMFATLCKSGTPVKKHLESIAYLGQPNDVSSLGNETYKTICESPLEAMPEPNHTNAAVEPPSGGRPTTILDTTLWGVFSCFSQSQACIFISMRRKE